MVEVHRGAGMLAPISGILLALLMNVVTVKAFGDGYYQKHAWPKLAVLLLSGVTCLAAGLHLKRRRARDAEAERAYIDSLSTRFGAVKELAFAGPRDHLMFIPLQYWSLAYFLGALVYGLKSL